MCNGTVVKSKRKDRITVVSKKGCMSIHEVLYVLDLTQNLLSVGQFIDLCLAAYFEGGWCKICDKIENKRELKVNVRMEKNRNFPLTH